MSPFKIFAYGFVAATVWGPSFVVQTPVLAASTPSPLGTGPTVSVPLEARHESGVHGTVTLSPQGNSTIVHVTMSPPRAGRAIVTLRSGSDCQDAVAASSSIPLAPVLSGQPSRTIVAIPIASFKKSNFVVDVRDMTTREQFVQACAHLGR